MANKRPQPRSLGVGASGHADSARRAGERLTESMDRVCDDIKDEADQFVAAAAHRVLEQTDW